jgi:hypothetical protein
MKIQAYLEILADLGIDIESYKGGFLEACLGEINQEFWKCGREQ